MRSTLAAQSIPAGQSPGSVRSLTIRVLQGDKVVNNVETHSATRPVVEVRDENDLPMEAVTVTFELPASGPGGYFSSHQTVEITKTDSRGQASPTGYVVNRELGQFSIKVTAVLGERTAFATMTQTNSSRDFSMNAPAAPKHRARWWTIAIIGAAAGVAIGLAVALNSGGSSSTSSQVTIGTGGVTVGAPH